MRRLSRLWIVFVAALAIGATAIPASAAFPGHNGKIVFSSNRNGSFQLYSMNPDGSGVTQITSTTLSNQILCARGPWVSADGTKIVFHGNQSASCGGGTFDIYTVNVDGSGLQQLTNGGFNDTPAWSPDGDQIAYVSNQTADGTCQVFEMNADGSGKTPITHLSARGLGGLSWSGSKIVYGTAVGSAFCPGSSGAGTPLEIHVVNDDGSNDVVLETDFYVAGMPFDTSRHPDWSPDGSSITFASSQGSNKLEIWKMNADGSKQTSITHQQGFANFSRFSPDGTQIVYQALSGTTIQIQVVGVDGHNQVALTNDAYRNIQPSWGPEADD